MSGYYVTTKAHNCMLALDVSNWAMIYTLKLMQQKLMRIETINITVMQLQLHCIYYNLVLNIGLFQLHSPASNS